MKRLVVTYVFNDKNNPGVSRCGMQVLEMEGFTRCDQWNDMMDAIAQKNPDAILSSICILYTKELIDT